MWPSLVAVEGRWTVEGRWKRKEGGGRGGREEVCNLKPPRRRAGGFLERSMAATTIRFIFLASLSGRAFKARVFVRSASSPSVTPSQHVLVPPGVGDVRHDRRGDGLLALARRRHQRQNLLLRVLRSHGGAPVRELPGDERLREQGQPDHDGAGMVRERIVLREERGGLFGRRWTFLDAGRHFLSSFSFSFFSLSRDKAGGFFHELRRRSR